MKDRLIVVFFLVILLIAGIWLKNKKNDNLNNNHKFTICKVTNIAYGKGVGWLLDYKFFVNGKKNEDKFLVKERCVFSIKKYYIVKYETNNPSNSIVLCDKYITNKEVTIPKEGWAEIPDTITFEKVPDECRCNW